MTKKFDAYRKKKIGRDPSHRKALLRSLTTSLIEHDKVETTLAKAKLVKPRVEKLITKVNKSSALVARRYALAYLYTKPAVKRLLDNVAPRFKERAGGYTRIVKLGKVRDGDKAAMARLEFVE